jgi:peptidoglycan/xylan/chitin deacetylase (PgdA/CDA1 family)
VEEAVGTGLVEIGSHTHHHLDLSTAVDREAEREMRRSRDVVEERLGRPCRHFAYPWGVASEGADRAARRIFDTAVLAWGTNRPGFDRHRLGRLPVLRSDGPLFFRAKVRGLLDGEAWVYRVAGAHRSGSATWPPST